MHGEYIGFKYDQKYGSNTEIVDVKDMRIPLSKIAPEMLRRVVTKFISRHKKNFTICNAAV